VLQRKEKRDQLKSQQIQNFSFTIDAINVPYEIAPSDEVRNIV